MIAKYKGQYFNISPVYKKPIKIWRYDFVEGFEAHHHEDGFMVYKKFVDIAEIDEIFDVGFSALWNGKWCGFDISFETNRIEVYSNNPDFAKKYNMETIEHFAYKLIVPLSSISEFKVVYKDSKGKPTREEIVSLDELKVLWKQFYTDLLPH